MDYKSLNQKIQDITGMNNTDMGWKDRFYPSTAIDDPKKISYFTQRKVNDLGRYSDFFDPEIRKAHGVMTKPGKFFRHINPALTDSELQKMVANWYNIVSLDNNSNDFEFELTSDIVHYYNERQYYKSGGSLGSSCMRSCDSFIEFYDNYDVELLILKNSDGKISGRALVWKAVYFPELDMNMDFMDRVYTNDMNDEMRFFDFAEKNGMVRKAKQSYSAKYSFFYDGREFMTDICIDCQSSFNIDGMEYPYLDTLSSMSDDCNLSNDSNGEYYIDLDSTDGTCSETGGHICEDCGNRFNPDNEGVYIEGHGSICDSCLDSYSFCEECETYVHDDYMNSTHDNNRVCDSCLEWNYTLCDDCNEYFKNDEINKSEHGDYCDDCCLENIFNCDECGLDFKNDDGIQNDDGEFFCEACYHEKYCKCDECGEEIEIIDSEKIDGVVVCEDCAENIELLEVA